MAHLQEAFHVLTNMEFYKKVKFRSPTATYEIVRYFVNKYEAQGLVNFSAEDEKYLANWGLNPGTRRD